MEREQMLIIIPLRLSKEYGFISVLYR